jgi:hypothetical protein
LSGSLRRSCRVVLLAAAIALALCQCSRTTSESSSGSANVKLTGPKVGLTGPVGPVTMSCHGITITAADNVQQVIDANPPDTTLCLAPATYRLAVPLVPKRGDALIGQRGAVLNGSKVITAWKKDGTAWSAHGFLTATPNTHGQCTTSAPLCTHTQDVFFDGTRLRQVASRAAVTAGTVHENYLTDTVTIGKDPQSHLVEQAVATSLIKATVADVTVENLVVEEAANEAQVGAIESRGTSGQGLGGTGWKILHNKVLLNHGVGIGFAGHSAVASNLITKQGQLGFGSQGTGSLVTDNDISYNDSSGYSPGWEAGGSKSWGTADETLTHNYVHNNMGSGFWDDGGTVNTIYEYNLIVGNWGAGIQHEISYDATIEYNEISGNGFGQHLGWAWDAGIQIQSSGGAKLINVAGNVVIGNYNGIAILDSGHRVLEQPMPHGPHIVRNVWVHNNIIAMSGNEHTGAVEDDKNNAIFSANHNRFNNNVYYLWSLTGSSFTWANALIPWQRWRGYGNDRQGTAWRLNSTAGKLVRAPPAGPSGRLPEVGA